MTSTRFPYLRTGAAGLVVFGLVSAAQLLARSSGDPPSDANVDWLRVHITTPNTVYVGRGFPLEHKERGLTLQAIQGSRLLSATIRPGLEVSQLAEALRTGTERPGGVVRLAHSAEGARHRISVSGTRILIESRRSGEVVAEKDYVDLLERHPTSDRQRLTLSVHYDEPSESFLVPIEYLPIPFERPHGSTSYFLVIPDASPGGRWRGFSVPTYMSVDYPRLKSSPEDYGLFAHRGRLYWVLPDADVTHVRGARRVYSVHSIPTDKAGVVEVEIIGNVDREVRRR